MEGYGYNLLPTGRPIHTYLESIRKHQNTLYKPYPEIIKYDMIQGYLHQHKIFDNLPMQMVLLEDLTPLHRLNSSFDIFSWS